MKLLINEESFFSGPEESDHDNERLGGAGMSSFILTFFFVIFVMLRVYACRNEGLIF